ncbi:MAG: hypothetical protein AAB630_00925, partial [Patescibacteria group bacterium]
MKVLIVADSAEERTLVRAAVLEALQDEGECLVTTHKDCREICLCKQPDLVVVCDYDEVSPMACATGMQSYTSMKEIGFEKNLIRMGWKAFPYPNYCTSKRALKALVYMHHRERGGPIYNAARR